MTKDTLINYVELPCRDLSATKAFFAAVINWTFTDYGPAYVEFRDEKVCFFIRQLARGRHSLSYRLRAEVPGKFSALPAQASAMYAPELRGNSAEIKVMVEDQ